MIQIVSGFAFFVVLMAWLYFYDVIYRKQKHEAEIRNGLAGTRRTLYRSGKMFISGSPVFLFIFFQRMTGLYVIPPEWLSSMGTVFLTCMVWQCVYFASCIYPVDSFKAWFFRKLRLH